MTEAAKQARTTAKRKFTRCSNRLNDAIETNTDPEIITAKYNELSLLWDDVQSKHDVYLFAKHPGEDEPVDDVEDEWIGELGERFDIIQKAKFEYERQLKSESKHFVEVREVHLNHCVPEIDVYS